MHYLSALLLCAVKAVSSVHVRDEHLPFLEYYTDLHDEADLAYRLYAFPHDELASYAGRGRDDWGGLAVQVIDSWDTLLVLNRPREFHARVLWVIHTFRSFDIDVAVSVFETNIRVLGGLLAGHAAYEVGLVPTHPPPSWGVDAVPYDGALLRLAEDLHSRLRAAFATSTGLPYGAVNLRSGVASGETSEVCLACCGTFSLEFNALSCFTNSALFTESRGDTQQSVTPRSDRTATLGGSSSREAHRGGGGGGAGAGVSHAAPGERVAAVATTTSRGASEDASSALNALARYSRHKVTGLAAMHVMNNDGASTPQDASVGAQGDSLYETLHKASHASMMCEGKRSSHIWGRAAEESLFISDGGGRAVREGAGGRGVGVTLENALGGANKSAVSGGGRAGGSGAGSMPHGRGGVWGVPTSTTTGELRDPIIINSLSYFYNALRVYDGDPSAAAATAAPLHALQRALGAVPEGLMLLSGISARGQNVWPLRPEVIEGYAALAAATADTQWTDRVFSAVAMMAARGRSPVGYGGVVDTSLQPAVVGMSGPLSNKQETFFLGEVIKYAAASVGASGLYEEGVGGGPYEGAFVMTTEAHPLPVNATCYASSVSNPSARCASSATTLPSEPYSPNPFLSPPSSARHSSTPSVTAPLHASLGGAEEGGGSVEAAAEPGNRPLRRLLSFEDALRVGKGGHVTGRGDAHLQGAGRVNLRAEGEPHSRVPPTHNSDGAQRAGGTQAERVVQHIHHPVVDLSRTSTPPKFRPSPHYSAPCLLVGMEDFLTADGIVVGGRGAERHRGCM